MATRKKAYLENGLIVFFFLYTEVDVLIVDVVVLYQEQGE